MRITEDSIRRGWAGVRHGFHHAHQRVMHMAGQVDNAVRVAGRAYNAVSPLFQALDRHHGTRIHSGATRAFNEYENVSRMAHRAEGYRQKLTDDVRQAAPELGV